MVLSALNDLANFISSVSKETNENPEGIISSVLLLEKVGITSITKAMENFSEAPKHFVKMINNYSNFVERSNQNWGETFKELIERQKKITEAVKTAENDIKKYVGENFEKYLGGGSEILQKIGDIDTKINTAKKEIETHIDNSFTNYLGEGSKISRALGEIKKGVKEHNEEIEKKFEGLFTKHRDLKKDLKEIKTYAETIKETTKNTEKLLEEDYQQILQDIDIKVGNGLKTLAERLSEYEKLEKKEEDETYKNLPELLRKGYANMLGLASHLPDKALDDDLKQKLSEVFVNGLKKLLEKYSDVEEISSIAREYKKIEECLKETESELKKLEGKIDEKNYTNYSSEIEELKKEFDDLTKNLYSSIQEYENRKEEIEYRAQFNNYTESLKKLSEECQEINKALEIYRLSS